MRCEECGQFATLPVCLNCVQRYMNWANAMDERGFIGKELRAAHLQKMLKQILQEGEECRC
jgi:hypothetical protein